MDSLLPLTCGRTYENSTLQFLVNRHLQDVVPSSHHPTWGTPNVHWGTKYAAAVNERRRMNASTIRNVRANIHKHPQTVHTAVTLSITGFAASPLMTLYHVHHKVAESSAKTWRTAHSNPENATYRAEDLHSHDSMVEGNSALHAAMYTALKAILAIHSVAPTVRPPVVLRSHHEANCLQQRRPGAGSYIPTKDRPVL